MVDGPRQCPSPRLRPNRCATTKPIPCFQPHARQAVEVPPGPRPPASGYRPARGHHRLTPGPWLPVGITHRPSAWPPAGITLPARSRQRVSPYPPAAASGYHPARGRQRAAAPALGLLLARWSRSCRFMDKEASSPSPLPPRCYLRACLLRLARREVRVRAFLTVTGKSNYPLPHYFGHSLQLQANQRIHSLTTCHR